MGHCIINNKNVLVLKKLLNILELIPTRKKILTWVPLSRNSFSSVYDIQILRQKANVNNNLFRSKHSFSAVIRKVALIWVTFYSKVNKSKALGTILSSNQYIIFFKWLFLLKQFTDFFTVFFSLNIISASECYYYYFF